MVALPRRTVPAGFPAQRFTTAGAAMNVTIENEQGTSYTVEVSHDRSHRGPSRTERGSHEGLSEQTEAAGRFFAGGSLIAMR
jgi:hypothetical protein